MDYHYLLAELLIKQRKYSEATKIGENAIETFKFLNSNFYLLRANIYTQTNQLKKAEADYRKLIEIFDTYQKNNIIPYYYWDMDIRVIYGNLGCLLIQQGKFAEALPITQKAHELAPESYAWTINLGHTNFLQGDKKTAMQYYRKCIPQIPDKKSFIQGPKADFELFIKNGWKAEESRAMLQWMETEFDKAQKSTESDTGAKAPITLSDPNGQN